MEMCSKVSSRSEPLKKRPKTLLSAWKTLGNQHILGLRSSNANKIEERNFFFLTLKELSSNLL